MPIPPRSTGARALLPLLALTLTACAAPSTPPLSPRLSLSLPLPTAGSEAHGLPLPLPPLVAAIDDAVAKLLSPGDEG